MLVKFCGMRRQSDLDYAAKLGADFCGFIFHDKSPRFIAPEAAKRLESGKMRRVGVFVRQNAEEILEILRVARLDLAQLHGGQDAENLARLAGELGPERLVRVLWPGRMASLAELEDTMRREAAFCGHFLLDAGGIGAGGTGETLDWAALSRMNAPRPWLLAGGLQAENLARALAASRPDGVDLNSGVEDAPGQKNQEKMAATFALVRAWQNRCIGGTP